MTSLHFVSAEGTYDARLAQLEADLDRLGRRLRSLSTNGWRPREAAVRILAQQLADLAAALEGGHDRAVPGLPVYALADAIAVLGGDVLANLSKAENDESLLRAAHLVAAALAGTA